MEALTAALYWLDYAVVAVFGATGALAAARHKHDIITFGFFAAITGVGGGTLRDLLIGAPVFWVQRPGYVMVCLLAAVLVWFSDALPGGRSEKGRALRAAALLWLDAVGLAAYAVVGTAKALNLGVHPFSAMVMGVLTTAFGGVIRDVLAGEPNLLLRREIYITAALLGAGSFVGLTLMGMSFWPAGLIAFALAFALRGAAMVFGLSLPGFRAGAPD